MSFTFILPVVHPEGAQVRNYSHVEMILHRTLTALQRQTSSDVNIVVVCCRLPNWAGEVCDNVFFLDASDSEVFKPDQRSGKDANLRRADRGLKIVLGILYAASRFETGLFMRVDADDYVNAGLAAYALESLDWLSDHRSLDGYVVNRGLEVG